MVTSLESMINLYHDSPLGESVKSTSGFSVQSDVEIIRLEERPRLERFFDVAKGSTSSSPIQ